MFELLCWSLLYTVIFTTTIFIISHKENKTFRNFLECFIVTYMLYSIMLGMAAGFMIAATIILLKLITLFMPIWILFIGIIWILFIGIISIIFGWKITGLIIKYEQNLGVKLFKGIKI